MHRRVAVERSCLSQRVGGHHDFVEERRRFDVVVANQRRLAATIGVHAWMVPRGD
jgi:hypothetical protein